MKRSAVIAATATSLAALVGANVAAASPIPKYTVTCVNGDRTIAQWQRVRVTHVTIEWFAADGTSVGSAEANSTGKQQPKGQVIVGTVLSATPPAQAQVTYTLDDGTDAPLVTVDCTA